MSEPQQGTKPHSVNLPKAAVEVGLADKVAFLSSPASYREETNAVEALETHMSSVFLTDRHAWKLKKPVRYSFLDFSTIEARRLNCAAEVRLNSRLAPDVYLGTVALIQHPDGSLTLNGDSKGKTVDWLVKMRRLRAEQSLTQVIARGAVTDADIRQVATRMAAFYRMVEPIAISKEAYRGRFEQEIESCCRELGRPEFGLPGALVNHLADALLNSLHKQDGVLDARVGHVVEGHGDLRPEHVYLNDPPVVIDCLEFNRDFRMIDPADELAYLAMECDRFGATAIDGWLFAAYRDESGDVPPRSLIEFYKCARAFLRAKLAIWHLDEPAVSDRSKWFRQSLQYLDLAEGYVRKMLSPRDPTTP